MVVVFLGDTCSRPLVPVDVRSFVVGTSVALRFGPSTRVRSVEGVCHVFSYSLPCERSVSKDFPMARENVVSPSRLIFLHEGVFITS